LRRGDARTWWRGCTACRRKLASVLAIAVVWLLARVWEPLGPSAGFVRNFLFVALLLGTLLGGFLLFLGSMEAFSVVSGSQGRCSWPFRDLMVVGGLTVWLGSTAPLASFPRRRSAGLDAAAIRLSQRPLGLGRTRIPRAGTRVHAAPGRRLVSVDADHHAARFDWRGARGGALPGHGHRGDSRSRIGHGKIGRAESALDPAPISMLETVINYKPEYITDEAGRRVNFRYDRGRGEFVAMNTAN
jgi:copper/silver efflux system protein